MSSRHSSSQKRDRSREREDQYDRDQKHYKRDRSRERDWDHDKYERHSRHDEHDDRHKSSRDGERGRRRDNQGHERQHRDSTSRRPITQGLFDETPKPNRIVLASGLNLNTTEEMLEDYVKAFGAVENVRINRDFSGNSQGTARIAFSTVEGAVSFMNYTSGYMAVDGATVLVEYEKEVHVNSMGQSHEPKDWICPHCNGTNFARRKVCYVCQAPKPDNPVTTLIVTDKSDKESPIPTSIIVVRGLGPDVTESEIWDIFSTYGTIKDIRLMRDKQTQISRGFCFVEYETVEEAKRVRELVVTNPILVNGLQVKIGYSQQRSQNDPNEVLMKIQQIATDPLTMINNSDAALMARFVYNPETGYHYDSVSTLYFEPTKNFYWHATTGQYFKWEPTMCRYMAWEDHPQMVSPDKAKEKKEKKKSKSAVLTSDKKNSKMLEKWNQKTKELKAESEVASVTPLPTVPSSTLNSTLITPTPAPTPTPVSAPVPVSVPAPVPAPIVTNTAVTTTTVTATETPNPESTFNPENIDWKGLVCLLCSRQFNSAETLKKHQQLSELHKANLEIARRQQQQRLKDEQIRKAEEALERARQRDSAKPKPVSLPSEPPSAPSNAHFDDENNVGSRLLQKMGWKKGEGIGKQNIIQQPLEVQKRSDRAGLGLHGDKEK